MTATGYALAGLLAAGIIFIGGRFLVAPQVAATGYGVLPDVGRTTVRAYLSVKGVRDIATGLFVVILMIAGETHLIGWVILAATIIPLGDALIVWRSGGSTAISVGVHGVTAGVMLISAALLLLA